MSKIMCDIIPAGSCPICSGKQFIVHEFSSNLYLLDYDGKVIDHNEIIYNAVGKCLNCGHQFEMMPTMEGFIPLTKLRKIFYEYSPSAYKDESKLENSSNPMGVN